MRFKNIRLCSIECGIWPLVLLVAAALSPQKLAADEPTDTAPLATHVQPFLAAHCLGCHSGEKPKGDFRLDNLAATFASDANIAAWRNVIERLETKEMPPKDKPQPSDPDRQVFLDALRPPVVAAEAAQRGSSFGASIASSSKTRCAISSAFRSISKKSCRVLPLDSSAAGFDNVGESLHTSSFVMTRYLEAADKALNLAIADGPQPPVVKKRVSLKDERHVKVTTERVFRPLDDGLVMFSSSAWQTITLTQFYPPDRGKYRFRISARGFQSSGKPVVYRIDAGPMLMATKNHLVYYFDAVSDQRCGRDRQQPWN